MATCAACNTTILLGGKRVDDMRFCNERCVEAGLVLVEARNLSPLEVAEGVQGLHRGPCPACGKTRGPVDVHMSYEVYSVLLYTSWQSLPHVVCRGCGLKRQTESLAFSLLAGWWGLPWGIFVTPVQILRNVWAMLRPPASDAPSAKLEQHVRMALAEAEVTSSTLDYEPFFTPLLQRHASNAANPPA